VLRHQIEASRLGHDRQRRSTCGQVCPKQLTNRLVFCCQFATKQSRKSQRAGKAKLFIYTGDEEHRHLPVSGDLQPLESCHHRSHAPLHIAGPSPPQPTITDQRSEWFNRHAINRNGVLVDIPEHDGGSRAGGRQPGDHVVPARRHWLPNRRNPRSSQPAEEVIGDTTLEILGAGEAAAHRVDAGTPHQIGKNCGRIGHSRHGSR